MPAELPTCKLRPKPAPYNRKQPQAALDSIPLNAATSAKPIKSKQRENLTLHDWLTIFTTRLSIFSLVLNGILNVKAGATPEALRLTKSLGHSELVPLLQNPVDIVCASDRPQRPTNKVFILDVKYTGETFSSKLQRVREEMAKKNAVAMAVTLLDEVVWLFNLRGTDIEFNPVFFAYAIVEEDSAILFINEAQVDDAVKTHFGQEVRIKPYEEFLPYLKGLTHNGLVKKEQPVLLGDKTSLAVVYVLGEVAALLLVGTAHRNRRVPTVSYPRRRCACSLLRMLEEQLNNGVVLSESEGETSSRNSDRECGRPPWNRGSVLIFTESELELFRGLSFTTISSTGLNAAIIHYSPDPKNCATITKDEIYLCDSGASTSTGRLTSLVPGPLILRKITPALRTPSEDEKRAFTRVLQGHIAIDSAIFPTGTTGFLIDSWARRALWQDGLVCFLSDYRHGTGHGVGHFLNVHEGPQGIGTRITYNNTPLQAGMTVSNEPGFYADGRWGIRIENVVVVREVDTRHNFGSAYLGSSASRCAPSKRPSSIHRSSPPRRRRGSTPITLRWRARWRRCSVDGMRGRWRGSRSSAGPSDPHAALALQNDNLHIYHRQAQQFTGYEL
ncbi:hypothetical protein BU15DRAFT_64352 [Melanogaster broomeanus]|nr:hypothetical protein BU15DRAFT_64352 [Melanogaster broomeanus]